MNLLINFFKLISNLFLKLFVKFKSLTLKKKTIAIIITIVLAIIGFQILDKITKKAQYTTARVEKTNIIETVSETGEVIAGGRADVYSPTNGIVEEVYVQNGEEVIEGQDLFSVRSSATEQEQQAAYANYLTAQTLLNTAESNLNVLRAAMYTSWDTFRSLATGDEFETGDNVPKEKERLESPNFQIAQDNWLAAEKKYKDQQTAVSQAKAQKSSTWLLYQATKDTTVRSPASGKISNLSVSAGSSVRISTLTKIVDPVLSVVKPSSIEVKISLSESDIAKVKPDQKAIIELNPINDKRFDGIVRRVDDIGTDEQGVIRYNAYIELIDKDNRIRSGMTADAIITTKKLTNVLSVPNSAVKPYQGGRAIRVPNGADETEFIPVVIGIRGASRTQIIEGVAEGQIVVSALSNDQIKRPGPLGF